jgi:protein-disulfide isomerase
MTTQATNLPHLTLPVGERDHIQGPATAHVTLVEYGDYQCPYCGRAHPILVELKKHIGARMRLVFRNFPLTTMHPNAEHAAEAAEAAGAQGKFWEMHDLLFEHQPHLDDAALLRYGGAIGLDVDRFERDLKQHIFAPRVREDFQSGIRSGVNGTPTFFINGARYDRAWDLEPLTAAVLAAAGERS